LTTFVLIHGAYQGGWIWQPVAERLRAQGHRVYTPTLDGCADRRSHIRAGINNETHGEEVADLLFYENLTDVVLVGTSCGGMVACAVAERARERITRIVFADALALMDGESVSDIVNRPSAISTEFATGVPPEDAANRLFSDLNATTKAWAVERTTLHPIAAMELPLKLPTFWEQAWDARVIWCKRSANPPRAHQERTAERLGATWHELDTGHYPMLSTPEELTALIV
jgi:pimeloyl-ACP methyl ester carboxylesterase